MKRRTLLTLAAPLLAGGLPALLHAQMPVEGRARGKLMWDPVYLELPPERKAPWERWLAEGARLREREIAMLDQEVARAGRKSAAPAKEGDSFSVPPRAPAWFAGEEARRMADSLLTWQTPSGGWSKNTSMKKPRQTGQRWSPWGDWGYVATIDNKATAAQIQYLALTAAATGGKAWRQGAERGLEYLLKAQMPSGGWPQVFPLQGSYHDQITFNDDAMVRVVELLREVKNRKGPWRNLGGDLRRDCDLAAQRGVECILNCQVRVNGRLTAWCAQHHPVSLAPVGARVYELASLSGQETVAIVRLLMDLGNPSGAVIKAVESAVDWLRHSGVNPRELGRKGLGGRYWARFYELGTNRPLFSDSDGKKRYSFREVKSKRNSYSWFTEAPAALLDRDYPRWRKRNGK